jgi:signal transduction histidine kinase
MFEKILMGLVIATGTNNAVAMLRIRARFLGHQRVTFLFLSLSSLALVSQAGLNFVGLSQQVQSHPDLAVTTTLAWALTTALGLAVVLAHRPATSRLSRILDLLIACLGVFCLIWTTMIPTFLGTTDLSVISSALAMITFVAISCCTGLSLTLSRVAYSDAPPVMVMHILSSMLIGSGQALLVFDFHSSSRFPYWVPYLAILAGLAIFRTTYITAFRNIAKRFRGNRIRDNLGLFIYFPFLTFPVVGLLIDHEKLLIAIRNVLFCTLIIVLIIRIRLFEEVAHRRSEVLERRINQRTNELAQAHALVLQIMDVAEDGMIAVDGGNQPLILNKSARTILQLVGSTSTDQTVNDPVRIDENPIREIFATTSESQAHHARVQREILIGGETRTLEILVRRIDQTTDRLVAVFRDVTDDLSLLQKKSRFVSMVSHEIRTPLTSLSGSLSLLKSGKFGLIPPEAARMIDIAVSSSDRLVRLVNDVLLFNRLEAEESVANLQSTPVSWIIREAIDSMQPLAHSQCQTIEGDVCDATVLADRDRVHQVLINLIQNATKFSPSLSIIRVSARPLGDFVLFEVSDDGRGIPESSIESIFEPFYQVDGSDSRAQSGTGLGLAVCRGIVELHGGRIWAENRTPHGTSVFFTIPRHVSAMKSADEKVA